jgi:hypothetical protein
MHKFNHSADSDALDVGEGAPDLVGSFEEELSLEWETTQLCLWSGLAPVNQDKTDRFLAPVNQDKTDRFEEL